MQDPEVPELASITGEGRFVPDIFRLRVQGVPKLVLACPAGPRAGPKAAGLWFARVRWVRLAQKREAVSGRLHGPQGILGPLLARWWVEPSPGLSGRRGRRQQWAWDGFRPASQRLAGGIPALVGETRS